MWALLFAVQRDQFPRKPWKCMIHQRPKTPASFVIFQVSAFFRVFQVISLFRNMYIHFVSSGNMQSETLGNRNNTCVYHDTCIGDSVKLVAILLFFVSFHCFSVTWRSESFMKANLKFKFWKLGVRWRIIAYLYAVAPPRRQVWIQSVSNNFLRNSSFFLNFPRFFCSFLLYSDHSRRSCPKKRKHCLKSCRRSLHISLSSIDASLVTAHCHRHFFSKKGWFLSSFFVFRKKFKWTVGDADTFHSHFFFLNETSEVAAEEVGFGREKPTQRLVINEKMRKMRIDAGGGGRATSGFSTSKCYFFIFC